MTQLAINFDGPQGLANEERLVLSLLIRGRQNARNVDILAEMTGIHRRHIEKIVKRLIEDRGVCIGSSSGRPSGYYIIENPEEVEEVYKSLRHRGIEILKRAAKLKKISVEEVFGQGRMEL